ncbi:phosphoribosyl-ATP diphosphatase [Pseudoroseomonas wenyumeiae]|uniref:Phosphoribosyl-ATP pyrophosphatase n=1 Tax=Teichococcus wenyumeiae TaxID=2478470 RepID=A0A3A9JF90_9PROT|nr:phosphoribosyl-ATP diphosphatase [Pseudoroseomonas wenyumeiae]RKK02296.1 phosphoribosyl-ATP diphosphatase [Pseudoroseomonas wenyumeiae]RMI26549.1 phosphoribosyl-ATP diphosphatase [Pseudoroseomonas wenyumeiae]
MAKDVKKKTAAKPVAKKPAKKLAIKKKAALPLPATLQPPAAAPAAKPRKSVKQAEARHLAPLEVPATGDVDVLRRLWDTIEGRRVSGDTTISHSARLLARGTAKVAQKLGEEAVECVIEATLGNRSATVLESADLIYHLLVVWVDAGIRPEEVWAELVRREGISGIAEKASRPKGIVRAAQTTKIP